MTLFCKFARNQQMLRNELYQKKTSAKGATQKMNNGPPISQVNSDIVQRKGRTREGKINCTEVLHGFQLFHVSDKDEKTCEHFGKNTSIKKK